MNVKECKVKKKYKLVAPDGGWGYMIALSAIINLATTTMFQGSFGLMYKEIMDDLNVNSTHVTMMMGIGSVVGATAAFLTNVFLKIMSMRKLALIAALLFNVGMIGSVFVNSIFTFYIFSGILPNVSVLIILNTSFCTLNQYFVKRRMVVISFCQTVIALLNMIVPIFLRWSLEKYGCRGTLLLVSGISLNCIFGTILIQPVELHMKKIEIEDKEEELLINKNDSTEKPKALSNAKLSDVEGNTVMSNEKSPEILDDNIKNNRVKKIIDAVFEKSLRKTFLLSCVCYGPSLSAFAESTFGLMLPQALFAAEWNQDNVAFALSLVGFGDLAMRIIFIFIGNWIFKFGSAEVYLIGILVALVAKLGILWTNSFVANIIFITITGFARCSIFILIPVVIADFVLPHQFSSAMGIAMMLSGITNLTLGFAIGAVRDLTQSYAVAFYLLTSLLALVAIFWSIELCYKKNKHKREQRRQYLRQKKNNKG